IYRQQVTATAAYTRLDAGAHPLQIKVTYQGCADAGLCYPPITKVIFPQHSLPVAPSAPHPFVGAAILGGVFAFLLAGLLLRKDRKLDLPAARTPVSRPELSWWCWELAREQRSIFLAVPSRAARESG